MKNIQNNIDEERKTLSIKQDEFYRRYHRYEEILTYLRRINQLYPTMSEIVTIGRTYENRTVYGIRIHSPGTYQPNKSSAVFSALQHSREWIAPMVNLYAMSKFLEEYSRNDRVRNVLDKMNLHFIPVINVDGYEFSHTNARLWRKNRRNNRPHNSFGVDINRNWPYQWGGQGSSSNPAADTYHGVSPASEIETQNIINYAKAHPSIKAAIDFHSYSELILRPWQYSNNQSPDEAKLFALGAKLQTSIQRVHSKRYQNIRGSQLYVHSGAMVDFWYHEVKVPSFTVELRPDQFSGHGFILPPQFIIPTCEENFPAVIDMCEGAL